MARVHNVGKAQKDQGNCAGCGKPIHRGDAYSWVKASRYAMKFKRHPKCLPFLSTEMEGNEKKAQMYQAQKDFQNTVQGLGVFGKDDKRSDAAKAKEFLNDLEGAYEELISQAEEVYGMFEESYDNMPEGLQQGDTGQQLEEYKDQTESYKDAVEQAKDSMEEFDQKDSDLEDWIYRLREEADQAAGELEY